MKKLITFIFLSMSIITYGQTWQWARSEGGTSEDQGYSTATDANGNVYVTGTFFSSFISFGSTILTNNGFRDIFIVKYDGNGNVLWAKCAGGTTNDFSTSITIDGSGNVIVTGEFTSSSFTVGSITLNNANGAHDFFILKYDPDGNIIWAKNENVAGSGLSLTTDISNNIYITGYFSGNSNSFGSIPLSSAGQFDVFIVKYDSLGNVIWVKSAGGTTHDSGHSIALDGSGNIYVTGSFTSPILNFGSISLSNISSSTFSDIFVVKYDPNGTVLWAKREGDSSSDEGLGIVTEGSGNVYVTGHFRSSSITFGSTVLINTAFPSDDIFTVKYDANGNILWANSAGGTFQDLGQSIATDVGGNIYILGSFNNSSINFGSTTLTNAGGFDIFLVKYNPLGNVIWALSVGGIDREWGKSIATDGIGNVFVTGYYESSLISFGSTTLINAGSPISPGDMFIAKLSGITGLGENNFSYGLNVFPNPSKGEFNISGLPINAKITLKNLLGEIISETFASGPTEILKLDVLNGVYFVFVKGSDMLQVKKIVIDNR